MMRDDGVILGFGGSTNHHDSTRSRSFLLPNLQSNFCFSIKLDYYVEGEGGLLNFGFCCYNPYY
jgi:hypothetical protein